MRGEHGSSLVMSAAPDPAILHPRSGTTGQPLDLKRTAERGLPGTVGMRRILGAKPDHDSAMEPDLTGSPATA